MSEELSAVPLSLRTLQPSNVFQALGNATRLAMIRRLAAGVTLCVKDFVPLTRMTQDGVCRHIAVLLSAGLVEKVRPPDGDRRKSCYQIPSQFLVARNGLWELECGSCVVRLNVPVTMASA